MKVSVIIPTYNRPGYLAQAVHSVLQQTHPVHEIIIVDDGSDTKCRPRIDILKQLDDRIGVFHFPENKGVSAARNYGLEKSGGDYILFLDDDDLLHPGMVESNLEIFASDSEADVVSSGYDIFFDTNPPDSNWNIEDEHTIFPETILLSYDYGDTSILAERPFTSLLQKSLQVSSCLVSRKAIGSARFAEDLTRGEDIFFWLTLANAGCNFRINHAQLNFHRLHRYNSLSAPGWRAASLESRLKLLHGEMVTELHDRLLVHLNIARLLLRSNQVLCIKHIFTASRIFISYPLIPYWPMIIKSITVKVYDKLQRRKFNNVRKKIISRETYGIKR